jgi:solute:Na+ symporter, SSS family
MTPDAVALSILVGIVALGSSIGFLAARRRQFDLEEWAVAGRGLGLILVWILMAGETFTTFSVLGISGWIYSKGGPTLYVLVYLTLGQILVFFIGPTLWELGRRHGLQTLGDFFARRYGDRLLAAVVALAGVLFLIVYLQLQLTGLGIIVEVASFERIGRAPAMLGSTVVVACFVLASGVRGVVWVSVLKDFLLVAVSVIVGIGLPYIHFGGIGPMFTALIKARPEHLTMPGGTTNLTHSWFISTVLVNSLLFAWPHFFGSLFTAKNGDTVRRNALIMPLYVMPLALIIFAGCAAILISPGLGNGDLALLTAVRTTFPPWLLGVIGGAGALTAMVPAAIQILTASTLVAKNVYRPLFAPEMSEERIARVARVAVGAVTVVALYLALHSSATLVGLLILAYSGIAQFAPGIVLGLYSRGVTGTGVLWGLLTGLALAGYLTFSHRDPFLGLNAGFIGLIANIAVLAAVSSRTTGSPNGFDAHEAPSGDATPPATGNVR